MLGKTYCVYPKAYDHNSTARGVLEYFSDALSAQAMFVSLASGDVVRARAIIRLTPASRWDADRVMAIKTTPLIENIRFMDALESTAGPHEYLAADRDDLVRPGPPTTKG